MEGWLTGHLYCLVGVQTEYDKHLTRYKPLCQLWNCTSFLPQLSNHIASSRLDKLTTLPKSWIFEKPWENHSRKYTTPKTKKASKFAPENKCPEFQLRNFHLPTISFSNALAVHLAMSSTDASTVSVPFTPMISEKTRGSMDKHVSQNFAEMWWMGQTWS